MTRFTQLAGEARYYQQKIVNDVISTSAWTISAGGATVGSPSDTDVSSTVLITTPNTGDFLASCRIVTSSGQTVIGEVRISAVECNV